MKAAIVTAPGKTPIYGDFDDPAPQPGEELIALRAAALSNLTRMRASGSHYSSAGIFPAVAGTDGVGVTTDGRRVYFALPQPPFGSMAEFCPIAARRTVPIPDGVDDVTAAAIANPGMSAWAALVHRANFKPGETVLVNGATGTAGRIAVQLARYLGAGRVIATGRKPVELEELKALGADTTVQFDLDPSRPGGEEAFSQTLQPAVQEGVNVVVDYLWGRSARIILSTLARTGSDAAMRFVHVGGAAGEENIELAGSVLRSSAITLMGSGIGSVSREALLDSIGNVFQACGPARLSIATRTAPLAEVETLWKEASGKPRLVFQIG